MIMLSENYYLARRKSREDVKWRGQGGGDDDEGATVDIGTHTDLKFILRSSFSH